jgi:hypothetical protein
MTTVAFDGTRMAADTMSDNGGLRMPTHKIFRTDAFVLGGCGAYGDISKHFMAIKHMTVAEVLEHGYPDWDDDDGGPGMILVGRRNPALAFYLCGPTWAKIERRYHAIGSGRDYALAAMSLGHDAESAVKLAISFDVYSGGEVEVVEV